MSYNKVLKKATIFCWFSVVVFIAAACTDSVSLKQLDSQPSRLVVYAFPSENDTIYITVSATCPINGKKPTLNVESIGCTTNGTADRIISMGDTIVEGGIPVARYLAVGVHRCGDKIEINAKATNLPEVHGSTVIPQKPTIESARLDTSSYKGVDYPVVRLSMLDNTSTSYYAVRIEGKFKYTKNNYMPLVVAAEPLLSNSSNIDFDLSDWDSDFFRYIYNFDNFSFDGGKATLHLYIDSWLNESVFYRPHLLAISPEYNNMLRSLNDISNNDFGKYGLAFAYITYTNVHGGYGCIGAYAEVVGDWLK